MSLALVLSLCVAQAAPSLGDGRAQVAALRSGAVATEHRKLGDALRSYGTEWKVISEALGERDGAFLYTRTMAVSNWARGMVLTLSLDANGKLLGGSLDAAKQEAPTAYGAYRVKTKLRLPLEDAWSVLWGGRSWDDNRHASVNDMRFALDLLQRKNGSSGAGRKQRNEDFHAWNQPVLAPADGVVVSVQNDVPDNTPGRVPGGNLYGNVIVIAHEDGEFSLLAHLKHGSVSVKRGQRVVSGQRIARVGSSGMSTEPHLHFQLMDTGDWKTAHGLPLQLVDFVRNGVRVERGEPRRGDVISVRAAAAQR